MNIDVASLIRPHVRSLVPYSSARDEFEGTADVFLDANESPFDLEIVPGARRYPDSRQRALRSAVAELRGVDTSQVFIGNGSDEAIDLLVRATCVPGRDQVQVSAPSYGMYAVCARINEVKVRAVPLRKDLTLDTEACISALREDPKVLFLCSPNNPTGRAIDPSDGEAIIEAAPGLVVVDEAYVDYCPERSFVPLLERYPNLVVLQTFSKAWGLAGLRVGVALGDPFLIGTLLRMKPPYNVSAYSQQAALRAIESRDEIQRNVASITAERGRLAAGLAGLSIVRTVFPSDANFLLVRFDDSRAAFEQLLARGIIVRDRSREPLCDGCLRITIGSPAENTAVLETLTALSTELRP